jgi:hypothetical protein
MQTVLSSALVAGWILYFSWSRLRASFADDDMANMAVYFRRGPWRMLLSQFLLWQDTSRPMAAAFYLPLHRWFGLNPRPYQVALLMLVAANTALLYLLARSLDCPKLAAGLAALAASYHPGLRSLQYNIDNIYDVLCFLCLFAALVSYIRIRRRGRLLSLAQTLFVLLLYLCALNSKEMAVVLPLILLAYEWIYRPGYDGPRTIAAWCRGPARIAILLGAVDLVYIFGKVFSPDPLAKQPAYRPVFTWQRLFAFQQGSLTDLFCLRDHPSITVILAIWAAMTWVAWRGHSPLLRFCWAGFVISPLPIEFLKNRFQGCLYIPMAFVAVLVATALSDAARALAEFLARESGLRTLSREKVFAVLIAGAVLLWAREVNFRNETYIKPAAAEQGIRAQEIIRQLDELHPSALPHTQVIFLNDPFVGYDMAFIAQLWFADPTVDIRLQRLDHRPTVDLAKADQWFDFREGKLVQLK